MCNVAALFNLRSICLKVQCWVALVVLIGGGCNSGIRSVALNRPLATQPRPETIAQYKTRYDRQPPATPITPAEPTATSEAKSQVEQASFQDSGETDVPSVAPANAPQTAPLDNVALGLRAGETVLDGSPNSVPCQPLPIDFSTALRLAGANNWSIQIADEKIRESRARYQAAQVMWLPSLQLGIGYNDHEGRIQETEGQVIDVSRSSLFAGAGATVGNSPAAGGSGGPVRLGVDLSLADSIFEPIARCQLVRAARAESDSVFNDTIMETGIAYFELLRAEAGIAMAQQNLSDASELVRTIDSFVKAGKGADADNMRVRVIQQIRQQDVIAAQGQRAVAAAQLARLLQLDPCQIDPACGLTVLDPTPLPIDFIGSEQDLDMLVAQSLNLRPEISQYVAQLAHAQCRQATEYWRPILPHVFVGASGGGFGGGPGTQFPDFNGRSDLDVIIAWELQNMGLGTQALRREANSQRRQTAYRLSDIRDQVVSEVTAAYFDLQAKRNQIDLAQQAIRDAQASLNANSARVRALEGTPLELIQAIESLAWARENFLNTVIDHNQAQLRLLNAVGGTPPEQAGMPAVAVAVAGP